MNAIQKLDFCKKCSRFNQCREERKVVLEHTYVRDYQQEAWEQRYSQFVEG